MGNADCGTESPLLPCSPAPPLPCPINAAPEEVDAQALDGDKDHHPQAEVAEVDGGEEDGEGPCGEEL